MSESDMSETMAVGPNERCTCARPVKRSCDECESAGRRYLSCSLACLEHHRAGAHGGSTEDSVTRAHAHLRDLNRRLSGAWTAYSAHRARLNSLIAELPQGGELCVFGAGNANDLELEQLVGRFREVHLVDLDAEALQRARDRQPTVNRAKIVLHERVDASGVLEFLDAWGDHFPDPGELARVATEAAQSIVHNLGLAFPAVVSTCLLSQLALPFERAWLTSRGHWAALLSTINAIHLATLAGSTRSGGRCLLAVDVASSADTPALADQHDRSAEELAEFLAEARAAGGLQLRPDPRVLVAQLSVPGMRALVARPELSEPWLWQYGAETRLVQGLTFSHP